MPAFKRPVSTSLHSSKTVVVVSSFITSSSIFVFVVRMERISLFSYGGASSNVLCSVHVQSKGNSFSGQFSNTINSHPESTYYPSLRGFWACGLRDSNSTGLGPSLLGFYDTEWDQASMGTNIHYVFAGEYYGEGTCAQVP